MFTRFDCSGDIAALGKWGGQVRLRVPGTGCKDITGDVGESLVSAMAAARPGCSRGVTGVAATVRRRIGDEKHPRPHGRGYGLQGSEAAVEPAE